VRCWLDAVMLLTFAGCDCGYLTLDFDAGADASADVDDARVVEEDAGEGDGLWILDQAVVELSAPECAFAEGQRVFVRGTVVAPNPCHQPGPVEVRRGEPDHVLVLTARVWKPVDGGICPDLSVYEDRWIDLGVLEQGTWMLSVPHQLAPAVTIEVGPRSGSPCAVQRAALGEPCETDCDCEAGRCPPDLAGGSCERRCADALPCGLEPDCLQGRCEPEMPESVAECLPTGGACADDADCPPAQQCQGERCAFREAEPFTPCTSRADCISGWSCVVNAFDLEHGVCAMRCFTERTPCPFGRCLAEPGFGPAWTCAVAAD
jgi:hypothetical protein